MTFADIQRIFNRSLAFSFVKIKWGIACLILALCGLLVVFFRGLALVSDGKWMSMSLVFLPFFLSSGILLATGIYFIRIYHDEVKEKLVCYQTTFNKSWDLIMGASYFIVPIILVYLMLWMLLGIFTLFTEIPIIGEFFSVILVLGPFLINLGSLLLCLLSIVLLFFVTPIIALKGMNRLQVAEILTKRFKDDLFTNLVLAFIGIFPMLVVGALLIWASYITDSVYIKYDKPIYTIVQWFFVMIPFVVFLAPAMIFFFNFAAESHVLMTKQVKKAAD